MVNEAQSGSRSGSSIAINLNLASISVARLRWAFARSRLARHRFVAGKTELNRRVVWMQARCSRQNRVGRVNGFSAPGCIGNVNEKARLFRILFRQFLRDYRQQFPFSEAMTNGKTGEQHLRRMSAEWVNLLQFRVRFLEHLKLDIAMRSAQAQLISGFERHGNRTI